MPANPCKDNVYFDACRYTKIVSCVLCLYIYNLNQFQSVFLNLENIPYIEIVNSLYQILSSPASVTNKVLSLSR